MAFADFGREWARCFPWHYACEKNALRLATACGAWCALPPLAQKGQWLLCALWLLIKNPKRRGKGRGRQKSAGICGSQLGSAEPAGFCGGSWRLLFAAGFPYENCKHSARGSVLPSPARWTWDATRAKCKGHAKSRALADRLKWPSPAVSSTSCMWRPGRRAAGLEDPHLAGSPRRRRPRRPTCGISP